MSAPATSYDEVAYPAVPFPQTAPEQLAVSARLAGLDAPSPASATVLEVGCGDGFNLVALAAAWPDAQFFGFDLAPTAIARGQALAAQIGLSNLTLAVGDILHVAEAMEQRFDYVIVHGVYAWVPPAVRAATMRLVGRVLAEDGVAFVSYNALPGAYLRIALREALMFALEGVEGSEARLAAAREHLAILANPASEPATFLASAMRDIARIAHANPASVLFHDEMGAFYEPQRFLDTVEDARANGLRYLGDASKGRALESFLPANFPDTADEETALLRLIQAADYRDMCPFRQTLFVRDHRRPQRRFDLSRFDGLYVSAEGERLPDGEFRLRQDSLTVHDPDVAAALDRLIAAAPDRVPARELGGEEVLRTLWVLYGRALVDFSPLPFPYPAVAGERPVASPLVRTMLERGDDTLCALDHRMLKFENAPTRALLALLDGTRDRAALAEAGRAAGLQTPDALDKGLNAFARAALLVA